LWVIGGRIGVGLMLMTSVAFGQTNTPTNTPTVTPTATDTFPPSPAIPGPHRGIDSATGSTVVIEHSHRQNHLGRHFIGFDAQTITGIGTDYAYVFTPATSVHLTLSATVSAQTDIAFSERCTTTGGTAVAVQNTNRVRPAATGAALLEDVTVSAAGVPLYASSAGSGQKVGSTDRQDFEWVLKPAVPYCIVLTSQAASSDTFLGLIWYE
jgi:hypothetical protein